MGFRKDELSSEQEVVKNQEFLQKNTFYGANQAFYITSLISEAIMLSEKDNITVSKALESLQLWFETKPEHYKLRYFEQGFLILQRINPFLECFSPYPHLALDALRCQKHYDSINSNDKEVDSSGCASAAEVVKADIFPNDRVSSTANLRIFSSNSHRAELNAIVASNQDSKSKSRI